MHLKAEKAPPPIHNNNNKQAYAARSLAGFIYNVGLLPVRHLQKHVGKAYDLYRSNDKGSHPDSGSRALAFRQTYDCREPVIRFLGCWDTVGKFWQVLKQDLIF